MDIFHKIQILRSHCDSPPSYVNTCVFACVGEGEGGSGPQLREKACRESTHQSVQSQDEDAPVKSRNLPDAQSVQDVYVTAPTVSLNLPRSHSVQLLNDGLAELLLYVPAGLWGQICEHCVFAWMG